MIVCRRRRHLLRRCKLFDTEQLYSELRNAQIYEISFFRLDSPVQSYLKRYLQHRAGLPDGLFSTWYSPL
jgi:hypothetical protein